MNFLRRILDALTRPIRSIFAAPLKLVAAPRRLLGMPLPLRVAVIVELLLILLVIASIAVVFITEGHAGWEHDIRKIAAIVVVLLIVIPWIFYLLVKLWLEGDSSRFPDIDDAWRAGASALQENGLDITSVPLFLLVGAPDERQVKVLMEAADHSWSVRDTPAGPAALHWYGNRNAIYVATTETCRLGELVRRLAGQSDSVTADAPFPAGAGGSNVDPYRGTIVAGSVDALTAGASGPETPDDDAGGPAGAAASIYQTMLLSDETDQVANKGVPPPPAGLPHAVAAEQTRRLEYVCQLVRRARQPVCPINGILSLLPFDALDKGRNRDETQMQIQNSVKEDLTTIRRALRFRAPVTALIVGMEREAGFHELVRRVGSENAKKHRFGKGCNVSNPPIPDQLEEQIEAVTRHACGAFEDWAYKLFREQGGLDKPGNTRLYQLLCKVRGDLCDRLVQILRSAYADDPKGASRDAGEPLLFSGCYFAATGARDDEQAFIKSIFSKLLEENEQVEWAREALAEEAFYQRLTQAGLFVDFVLLITVVGGLIYYYHRG